MYNCAHSLVFKMVKCCFHNTIPQVYKARRLSQDYSTCIRSIISVGRRRIRGTRRIVHIVHVSVVYN